MSDCLVAVFALALTQAAPPGALDARAYGAVGDAMTDDTAALQAALDAAGATGAVVVLPPGQYRCEGVLSIPPGVTLEGSWAGQHTAQLDRGSTLLAFAGRDDEAGAPFISLATASCLKGVTIFYPEQTIDDPRPYPWTVQGRGQHFNVLDTVIVNAWQGIDCGSFHNEGHHLRNVFLCALRRGVLIDQCSDIGRVENVHIHNVYWWRVSAPYTPTAAQVGALERFTLEHLEGFIIGRTDWEYITGCFVIWARVGFRFIQTETPVGGQGNVLITQSGSDLGPLAVLVERVQWHAGIAFENCQFMAGLRIEPTNEGPVKLTNCGFWGIPGTTLHVDKQGPGTLTLNACHFVGWDTGGAGEPCLRAAGGRLIVQGCEFRDENKLCIELLPGLTGATITGSIARGGELLRDNSGGEVTAGFNLLR